MIDASRPTQAQHPKTPVISFGLLSELADDPEVTDVAVTCEGLVWADRGEGMREHHLHVPFRSPAVVREYAVQLCAQLGRRLDDACPIADASSVEGVRVHAVIAPLVPQGAAISIRFPSIEAVTLQQLACNSMFPMSWLPLLQGLVHGKATILVTGGTGSGKTTLVKALLAECDQYERIVTVEEVRELGACNHANYVSLAAREANVEGAGAVGLTELVKATLRMRPDRVVLGECRGEEIVDLLRAFNSGHHGGMTTLHADSVARVPSRLVSLGLLADVTPQAMTMLAQDAFDAVLHVEQVNGRRHIAQIGLLYGMDGTLEGLPLARWSGSGEPWYSPEWLRFLMSWSKPNGVIWLDDTDNDLYQGEWNCTTCAPQW
ncbi:Flp pilus assembly complex ATPase component TadA [Bifidobacterium saguini]|nr:MULTISPECIES: ATPase, T2SS/T4P/T4SS family [Bifidobacterium]QSY58443.1 Flp pilus assembly complex ATPase component TadA [Bifidobacterium imperatoris]QTB92002.1 Flp pilus assembly complex ATPase component TadA [Bifidobacterium saguini]